MELKNHKAGKDLRDHLGQPLHKSLIILSHKHRCVYVYGAIKGMWLCTYMWACIYTYNKNSACIKWKLKWAAKLFSGESDESGWVLRQQYGEELSHCLETPRNLLKHLSAPFLTLGEGLGVPQKHDSSGYSCQAGNLVRAALLVLCSASSPRKHTDKKKNQNNWIYTRHPHLYKQQALKREKESGLNFLWFLFLKLKKKKKEKSGSSYFIQTSS